MRFLLIVAFLRSLNFINAQVNLKQLRSASNLGQKFISSSNLTQSEASKGLKEALTIGAKNAVKKVSQIGGFNDNKLIKIPFPKDAEKMKKILITYGMQSQINKFEYLLNQAAEEASALALDILINAVSKMTIDDAIAILKGDDNAATNYLKKHTVKKLTVDFKPIIKSSVEKVGLTNSWNILTTRYNSIPMTKDVPDNLEDYVTYMAIDGLFILIEQEESNIRNNPNARVTGILQRVFK